MLQSLKVDLVFVPSSEEMYPEKDQRSFNLGTLSEYALVKKSALVKKDMQILQHLLGKDENAVPLLKTAIQYAAKRVVVKRPIHAEEVGGIKPSTSISSKKTRYDVYIVNSQQ